MDGAELDAAGYEDWYLLEDWAAVGVLEEAAVGRGHEGAHDAIAAHTGAALGSVYRLLEGSPRPSAASLAVWLMHAPGQEPISATAALLGDGMDPERDGLWRRCLGLGPAPELCLLGAQAPAGVAASRLPNGWIAQSIVREVVWHG